ncbi:MAG: PDZ domain-containing protein, partial [Planctomycetota bacterium]|nr:PDZ domain-containing protein [Planctomycetota bacterium]
MRILFALLLAASLCVSEPPKRAGYLGAELNDVGERSGISPPGVRLGRILPDSPAAKAGLLTGDVIVRFGQTKIGSARELATQLRAAGEGAKVEIEVFRAGDMKTLQLELGVHPRVLLETPDRSPGMRAVTATRDLSYFSGDGEAHERHKLNLFVPDGDKPFPIVLWIHAGAWSYGDRNNETALAMRLAERGIGVAAMNYRLSSKFWNDPTASKEGVKHPAHVNDCAMAFAWLRKRYPEHPLFVSGHSCGAHLGALMA